MITQEFYKLIDTELIEILDKYQDDPYIKKNSKAFNNQKSYALLIWFLEFYGKKTDYLNYITDGNDDSSCDIIFDNVDNQDQRVFYIVQSKWNTVNNCETEIDKKDFLQALSDFDTIIRGKKEKVNEKLKSKINELTEHLQSNGDIKFIYLTLCNKNKNADDNIKNFLDSHKRTRFEFYDISRIKVDYIERHFKKIDPINPLENYYNPEESKINIQIEKRNPSYGNFIRLEKPFEAYVFLIKPKTIYELFEKYGFSLFFRNVRNPLIKSEFNREIERTAIDNPAYFWYYNNGLTAITYLLPEIRDEATNIELTGLQIINGAQTVYSVYKAYKEASPTKRTIIDSEALITLRLLKSGGRDFDLKVTRFTNSQNPIDERDFRANDEIQEKIQNMFFDTNFWYEKRKAEFRDFPEDVKIITNVIVANAYLAYHLQDPFAVVNNYRHFKQTGKDLLFMTTREHKDGLVERIFNENTNFVDLLVSYYLLAILTKQEVGDFEYTFSTNIYHLLSLFKIVFSKYCKSKYDEKVNINLRIKKIYESGDRSILIKIFTFLNNFLISEFKLFEEENQMDKFVLFLTSQSQFEQIKGKLENIDITVDLIENVEINQTESIVGLQNTVEKD